ncbi:hybrid sensor histidine kinase/response regulator [Marinospirillum sp. MEB164]|uniref:histidine kinase n=1 Tax=Marinospirillum alkalitolerans TaxID=3123374 RepID=A0ABW8PVV8_9GAMM
MHERLAQLEAENQRLNKINQALIERIEAGQGLATTPYAAFEQAAALAEEVKRRTTELTQANQQLRLAKQDAEQANQSKTKFLAAISHDVLQPLSAAKLFTAALKEAIDPAKQAELIDALNSSLLDVESLLAKLVDISKLDAGILTPQPQVIRLTDLLDNLAREYQQQAQHKKIRFRYRPCQLKVETDPHFLARILRNLLANALRYTREGRRVLLGCRRRGTQVEIQVIDQGVGIAADQLEVIFEEFQRLHTLPNEQGLGLGLAIAQRMASLLSAPLSVHSRVDQGSCFAVTLPLAQASAEPIIRPDAIRPAMQPLQGQRIWILDNDLAVCQALRHLLEGWECEVTLFQQLPRLTAWSHHSPAPDLLILDYHLQGQTRGLSTLEQLAWPDTPAVLVMTADRSPELKAQIHQLGLWLLHKPISALRLRQTLIYLLHQESSS